MYSGLVYKGFSPSTSNITMDTLVGYLSDLYGIQLGFIGVKDTEYSLNRILSDFGEYFT